MSIFSRTPLQQLIEGSYTTRQRNAYAQGAAIGFAKWLMKNNYHPRISSWRKLDGETPEDSSTEYLYQQYLKQLK